ncbi:MAG TPA: hypothetical protein PLX02_05510 [Syntrophorhabdaceae bacterium]|nr:hypothetical protein [Syntrophorhabdaceae bacterium]HQM81062.1 hypothetical protein [Syntrophorhabdaceae bacterium]
MINHKQVSNHLTLYEHNHVERPLLDQLHGLDWEIIDLDKKRTMWAPCIEFLPEIA